VFYTVPENPASLEHGAILSLGCMGNRAYTGLGEDEMYLVLRGKDLSAVADAGGHHWRQCSAQRVRPGPPLAVSNDLKRNSNK
jgi:hypothetical protein